MDCKLRASREYSQNVAVYSDGTFSICHDWHPDFGPVFHKHCDHQSLWDCAIDNLPRTAIGSFVIYRRGYLMFMLVNGTPFIVDDPAQAVDKWLLLFNNAAVFPMAALNTNNRPTADTRRAGRAA